MSIKFFKHISIRYKITQKRHIIIRLVQAFINTRSSVCHAVFITLSRQNIMEISNERKEVLYGKLQCRMRTDSRESI